MLGIKRTFDCIVRAVLVVCIITTAISMFQKNAKETCTNNDRNSDTQARTKIMESVDESVGKLVSKVDIFVTKLKLTIKDSPADNESISRSIAEGIAYLKSLVVQMENVQIKNDITIFLSQPVINNHNFSYIHNPEDTCSRYTTNLLLMVPSAPPNFARRRDVRSGNMGKYVRNITNKAKMLFFLGRPSQLNNSHTIQQKIEEEANKFMDIVQEDFNDVYRNIRLKSVSMLRWASTYCQNIKYIIRSDDDVKANIFSLISALDRTAEKMDNFMIGRERLYDVPSRNIKSKYYLSDKEYPSSTFPPYLLGGLLGFPIGTAKLLYEAALRLKPVWLEDVFISSMCAPKVHVPILSDPDFVFTHHRY